MMDKGSVLQLMSEADAVYLATVGDAGPRVRALVNLRRQDLYPGSGDFCRSEGFTSYFSTSAASGKVAELRANPAVAVYYSDPRKTRGVELSGRMEILTDPELKKVLWQDVWRIYWQAGPDDPDYVVLRLRPTRAAGWWGSMPFTLQV